mmetsp:Transcript_11552/g.20892  ORF Transcript_11552/g.20892 Transcript_11552/m.20892 type:complete len:100 (+) Transcript_11552:280-579(+)
MVQRLNLFHSILRWNLFKVIHSVLGKGRKIRRVTVIYAPVQHGDFQQFDAPTLPVRKQSVKSVLKSITGISNMLCSMTNTVVITARIPVQMIPDAVCTN